MSLSPSAQTEAATRALDATRGQSRSLRVILGTMTFAGQTAIDEAGAMVRAFVDAGHAEVDTARMYEHGKSEELIGALLAADPSLGASLAIASKANPFATHDLTLSADSVRSQVRASLAALGIPRLQLLYLHAPDPSTPISETLDALADLHSAGAFEELGLSNYQAWEVAHIHALCGERGLPRPTVYQGMYNALTREVERELLPCLRALGIRFYAYNPLAGGLLTGKHSVASLQVGTEGRFRLGNALYRDRYLHPAQLAACDDHVRACERAGIAPAHAALRWLQHHSALRAGDGVIVGASRPAHLSANLAALDEGPLPAEVLAALDQGWASIRAAGCCPSYERGTSKY